MSMKEVGRMSSCLTKKLPRIRSPFRERYRGLSQGLSVLVSGSALESDSKLIAFYTNVSNIYRIGINYNYGKSNV